MARQIATITFVTLLALTAIAASLGAQGRGGRGFGPGPARSAPAPGPGPGIAGRPAGPPPFARRVQPPIVPPIVGHYAVRPQTHIRFERTPYLGYAPYISPYVYPYPQVYAAPAYVEPAYTTPVVTHNQEDLTYEIQRLSREIEQLREEQTIAAARIQAVPLAPEPQRPAIPTTLVYRDGRRLTILNYAIVGQTLWILDEQKSTRIDLQDLDLEATVRENRAQGVRFPLPR